jgi:hypothetical protein
MVVVRLEGVAFDFRLCYSEKKRSKMKIQEQQQNNSVRNHIKIQA